MAFISFKGRNAFIIGHFITAYENEGFVEWTEQKILFTIYEISFVASLTHHISAVF